LVAAKHAMHRAWGAAPSVADAPEEAYFRCSELRSSLTECTHFLKKRERVLPLSGGFVHGLAIALSGRPAAAFAQRLSVKV
jgi:hypothetical protein